MDRFIWIEKMCQKWHTLYQKLIILSLNDEPFVSKKVNYAILVW